MGLTKKGKSTKWMLIVDGNGLPSGVHLDSASHAEVRLAEQILDTIRAARPRRRPGRRPDTLVEDQGYDNASFCYALRRRGIQAHIPVRRRPVARRNANAVFDWISCVALVGMEFVEVQVRFKVDTSWPAPVLQQHAASPYS